MTIQIDYTSLSRDVTNLDQALYVASCVANSATNRTVVIYCSTHEGVADSETGERYLVLDEDDNARHHLRTDERWQAVYRFERLAT